MNALVPEDLCRGIQRKAGELDTALRTTVQAAWELGQLLNQAKVCVGHDGFGRWLADNLPSAGERQAPNYMRLAGDYGDARDLKGFSSVATALALISAGKRKSTSDFKPPASTPHSEKRRQELESESERTSSNARSDSYLSSNDIEQRRLADLSRVEKLFAEHEGDAILWWHIALELRDVMNRTGAASFHDVGRQNGKEAWPRVIDIYEPLGERT